MAAGAFAPDDPKLTSFAILGAVNWIPRWFDPKGPASSQEIADRFADLSRSHADCRRRHGRTKVLRYFAI